MALNNWVKVTAIILSVFASILGIMNAIAYSSATDGACSGISKAWTEVMLVLNIVLIFISVLVVVLVTIQWVHDSEKVPIEEKIKNTPKVYKKYSQISTQQVDSHDINSELARNRELEVSRAWTP